MKTKNGGKKGEAICPICEIKFTPWEGQIEAQWGENWCTKGRGKLCPACHKVAEEFGAISEREIILPRLPKRCHITERSASVTKLQPETNYKKGDRVKISTGNVMGLPSESDYYGTIIGPATEKDCFMVNTRYDGTIPIHIGRLASA